MKGDVEKSVKLLWVVSFFIWVAAAAALFYLYSAVQILLALVL